MTGRKSLAEQLLAIFSKNLDRSEAQAAKGPPEKGGRPRTPPEPAAREREPVGGTPKRKLNLAALRDRLRGASESAARYATDGPFGKEAKADEKALKKAARGETPKVAAGRKNERDSSLPPSGSALQGRPAKSTQAGTPSVVPKRRPVAPIVAVPTVAPKPRPEAPKPWQPPRETLLLVDSFGSAATGPILREAGSGAVARVATSVGSIFRTRSEQPRVQVGLDFGTSSTKAMWLRLDVPDAQVRAIDFGHDLPALPSYCLPSLAAFDSKGNLLLGDAAAQALPEEGLQFALSRFKMLVAGSADPRYLDAHNHEVFSEHVKAATGDERNCTPAMLTTVYLAFAMRRVRRQLESRLKRTDVDVAFNTCVPVDQRENNRIFAEFDRIIGAAERLERTALDGDSARSWLEQAGTALGQGALPELERRLFLVPEAVAGTAAYVSSLRRDSGLHALIDIGAGTTDVSIFNLSVTQAEGATSFWYSARSVPYGAGHIESRLQHELRSKGERGSLKQVRDALGGGREGLPSVTAILHEELDKIRRATNPSWAEAYGHFKRQSAWTGKNVKVFIAGGGALIPDALGVFEESWNKPWGPYPCSRLPDPESYEPKQVGGPFVRISVAYGLTTPIPVLGRWVMPADAPNHTPPPAPVREWRQDGDQMTPNANW